MECLNRNAEADVRPLMRRYGLDSDVSGLDILRLLGCVILGVLCVESIA